MGESAIPQAQRPVPNSAITTREKRDLADQASEVVAELLLTDCPAKQRQVVSAIFTKVRQQLGQHFPECRVVVKGGAAFQLHMQQIVAAPLQDPQRLENASQQQKLQKLEGMLRVPPMLPSRMKDIDIECQSQARRSEVLLAMEFAVHALTRDHELVDLLKEVSKEIEERVQQRTGLSRR